MRIVEIKVYKIQELSEDARDTAINNCRYYPNGGDFESDKEVLLRIYGNDVEFTEDGEIF